MATTLGSLAACALATAARKVGIVGVANQLDSILQRLRPAGPAWSRASGSRPPGHRRSGDSPAPGSSGSSSGGRRRRPPARARRASSAAACRHRPGRGRPSQCSVPPSSASIGTRPHRQPLDQQVAQRQPVVADQVLRVGDVPDRRLLAGPLGPQLGRLLRPRSGASWAARSSYTCCVIRAWLNPISDAIDRAKFRPGWGTEQMIASTLCWYCGPSCSPFGREHGHDRQLGVVLRTSR